MLCGKDKERSIGLTESAACYEAMRNFAQVPVPLRSTFETAVRSCHVHMPLDFAQIPLSF